MQEKRQLIRALVDAPSERGGYNHDEWSSTVAFSDLSGLSAERLRGSIAPVSFRVVREPGSFRPPLDGEPKALTRSTRHKEHGRHGEPDSEASVLLNPAEAEDMRRLARCSNRVSPCVRVSVVSVLVAERLGVEPVKRTSLAVARIV